MTYPARPPLESGVTFIELLVVITLMGIIAALTLPGLYGIFEHQSISDAANDVVSAIKLAQNEALSNDQQGINDPTKVGCTGSNNYIDNYQVVLESTTTYQIQSQYRNTQPNGSNCPNPGATQVYQSLTHTLPSNVVFYFSPAISYPKTVVTYTTTSGYAAVGLSSLILKNNSLGGSTCYQISLDNGGKANAQSVTCP